LVHRRVSLQSPKTTASDLVQGLKKHFGVRLLQRMARRVSVSPSPTCEGGILRGCAGYPPLLKNQARVLETRAEHLVEEHPLRIKHLRNQLKEESIRHVDLRLKVAFESDVLGALVSAIAKMPCCCRWENV
jgi:hypothetical protein